MAFADIELVREKLGSIADVLERHGFDSRKGRILCPNPEHGDRKPGSVVILRGNDNKERLYCHVCFYTDDNIGLARLLGEAVVFPTPRSTRQGVPRRFLSYRGRPRTKKQRQKATRLRGELGVDETIELEWRFVQKVTPLFFKEGAVQREIDRNRDWLENFGCDIYRIQKLTDRLGQYAFKRFGSDDKIDDFRSWQRWVARAAEELEVAV